MNIHTIWIYLFDDGTQLELLDTGFSIQEIFDLEKLHGKCVMSHKRKGGEQSELHKAIDSYIP